MDFKISSWLDETFHEKKKNSEVAQKNTKTVHKRIAKTRSNWLNCALRDDEAVYWEIMRRWQLVIYDTGSVEGINAFFNPFVRK